MDDYAEDFSIGTAPVSTDVPAETAPTQPAEIDEKTKKLVARLVSRIKSDKKHMEKAHKRMRRDRQIARRGAPESWPSDHYVANIIGRHINQTTAALYAKNPKAVARRRERLDFRIWDETEKTLMEALAVQQQMTAPPVDPMSGTITMPPDPAMLAQAEALLADFQQGMQVRDTTERVGKTLQILFEYFLKEQKPVDFKTSMKQVVRRTKTCSVGFVKLGFQREYRADADAQKTITDDTGQMEHIRLLMQKTQDPKSYAQQEADLKELELSVAALKKREYVLVREGLVFDFPQSTAVIPDKACTSIIGFQGAAWNTVEYLYTPDQVRKIFGTDLGKKFTPYTSKGVASEDHGRQTRMDFDGEGDDPDERCCVWEHYDKDAGVCYHVCDGYDGFLREPGAPDVYVEEFWPIYALTFNDVEDPEDIIPPSDVESMLHMQRDWNSARQGKREHRKAARPRFITRRGAFTDEEKEEMETLEPFGVLEVNAQGENFDVAKELQAIPMPGVDPNLYDTGETLQDIQMTVGKSEAQFGATPGRATATGEALAEGATTATNDSSVDDLDAFLTTLARAAATILLREMSAESVMKIAGPGAIWPELTLEDLVGEIYLEIEAGSSGKPNAAQEIANWERLLPYLIQMGNISGTWLARETLRRLDDRMDLTDAIAEGAPSVVAMNQNSQPSPADPGADPSQQGPAGAQNQAPAGQAGPSGTAAPMGNNRV